MKSSKREITAYCDYKECETERKGTFHESDEHYDYYVCEHADESGIQHTFAVLNETGRKAKRENQVLLVSAGIFVIYQGVEIFRHREGEGDSEEKAEVAKRIIKIFTDVGIGRDSASLVAQNIIEQDESFGSPIVEGVSLIGDYSSDGGDDTSNISDSETASEPDDSTNLGETFLGKMWHFFFDGDEIDDDPF